MQKLLISPTINKYNTNELTLDDPCDYFHLCGKDLLEVVKLEPSKVYGKISRNSAMLHKYLIHFVLGEANIERIFTLAD